jgi:toxin ParE1/3/4
MANYRLTTKAIEDLARIWNYTADTWSENQADNYYHMLLAGW